MALLLFQTVAVVDRLGKNLPSVSWMYSTQGTFLDSGATEQGRFQLGRRANQILGSFHQFQTAYLSILPSINCDYTLGFQKSVLLPLLCIHLHLQSYPNIYMGIKESSVRLNGHLVRLNSV